jgi:FkbM family methyltransferase
MREEIEKRSDNLYWPVQDTTCYNWTYSEIAAVSEVFAACDNYRSIVHAGANVGAYALKFAERFNTVYAFEPDNINFKCLALNTINTNNILLYQGVLGCFNKTVNIENNEKINCGTGSVTTTGNLPQFTIDSLHLDSVDCIHLDVEGYEMFALMGALNTIEKHSPTIVLEWLDHGNRFGITQQTIINLLSSLGYNKMKQVASDMIFKKIKSKI